MERTFSLLKKLMAGFLLLGGIGMNAHAQSIDSAKYITVNQDIITVYLSEAVTLSNAQGWSVDVGGTIHTFNANTAIRPNIHYLSGSGTSKINFKLLFVFPKTNIDPDDVAAGVTVSYNGTGNTKNMLNNPMPADGPVGAVNDVIITCGMLSSEQSIGIESSSGSCQPVTVQMRITWNWYPVARNSIHFNTWGMKAGVFWRDINNSINYFLMTESPSAFGKFEVVTPAFTYQEEMVCTHQLTSIPVFYNKPGDDIQPDLLGCGGGTSRQDYIIPAYRLDNQDLGGSFQITPASGSFCVGEDIEGFIFSDATQFNCRADIEPDRPNEGTRWMQFVYGTHSGAGIPNVYIDVHGTMVQVTDANGDPITGPFTVSPDDGSTVTPYFTASGFFEGPVVIVPEPALSPSAQTFPIYHTGDYVNDEAGDVFEVMLRNWGPCNKYSDYEPAIETTAEIELIESPPAPNPGIHEHCFGSVPASISVTGSGGDIDWFSDSTLLNLIRDNNNNYTHGESAVGEYNYWVNETWANGCVGPDTLVTLTINPLPDESLPVSDPVICNGETAGILLENSVIGISYQLRRDSDNAIIGTSKMGTGGDITFDVTPGSNITYNILATDTATGCSNELTDKSLVTVNALPSITTHPQPRTTCEAGNTSFTIAASGPGLTYQWQVNDGGGWVDLGIDATYADVTTSTLSISNAVPAMDGYLYRVKLNTTGSCEIFSNSATLTVNPLPLDKNAVAVDPFLCYNTGTVIRIQSAQDGVSYTIDNGVNAPQTQLQSGTGNLDFNVGPFTPASTTTFTYSITAEALGCTSSLTDAPQVTVNPEIVLNAIAHPDICADGQIDLPSAPVSGGSAGTTGLEYAWTGTDITGSINNQDPAPFNPVLSGTHNINLQVTDANFRDVVSTDNTTCSVSGSLSFEVNPLPLDKTVIAQTSPLCYNSSTNIIIQSSQIGVEYTIYRKSDDSVLGTASGNGGNASVSTGNLTSDIQFYVIAENTTTHCTFRLSDEPTVVVNPRFELAQPESSQSICVNSSTTFSVTMTGGTSPYTLVYSDGTNNYTENNYVSGQAISTGNLLASTTYNVVSVTDAVGCTVESLGSPITVTVGQMPTTAAFSGGTAICDGEDATLSVNISGGAPPFDITIDNGVGTYTTGDFLSEQVLSGLAVGTHTYNLVSVTDACGNSVPGTGISGNPQTVTVNGLPDASGTSNNAATICNEGTTNITLASTIPAATINWTIEDPDGAGAAAGSGTDGDVIAQALTNTTDNAIHVIYHITPTGIAPTNCPGPTVDRTVQIEPTPKAAIANNSATICNNSNVDLNITSPTVPTVPGNLTFELEVTSTDDTHLSGTAASDLSGQSFPLAINGTLVNTSDNVIEVTYTVTPKLNGCADGDPVSTTVKVEPTPSGTFTNNSAKVCTGENIDIDISSLTVPSVPANLLYNLTVSSSNEPATGGTAYTDLSDQAFPHNLNGTLTNTSDEDITVTFTLTPKLNGCGIGSVISTDVVVEPEPKASITNTTSLICNGDNINLNISSPTIPSVPGDLSFDLTVSSSNDGATGGAAYANLSGQSFPHTINGALTNTSNEDITVTFTVTPKINGCAAGPDEVTTVTVEPDPVAAVINNTPLICSGDNVNLAISSLTVPSDPADLLFDVVVGSSNTGAVGGSAYMDLNDKSFPLNLNGTLTNISDDDITVTFTITPKLAGCAVGTPITRTVVVEPAPKAVINNTTSKVCQGNNVNLKITSPTVPSNPSNLQFDLTVSASDLSAIGGSAYADLSNQSFPLTINGNLTNTSDNDITVTYSVIPKLAGCTNGNPAETTVVVEPTPKAVISNSSPKVCQGDNANVSITSPTVPSVPGDLTFDLTVSSTNDPALGGAAASDLTGQSFPYTINGDLTNSSNEDITVTYTVTPKLNGCAVGPDKTTTIVVEPTPKAQISNSTPVVCEGDNVNLNITSPTIPSLPGNLSFDLEVTSSNDGALGGGASLGATNQTFPLNITGNLTNTSDSYITVTYTVTPKLNGCANGTVASTTVIVEPTPKAAISNPTPKICNAENINLAVTSPTVSSSAGDLLFDLVVSSTNDGALSGSASLDISNQTFPYNISGSLINSSDEDITVTFTVTPKINGCGTGAPVSTTLVVVEPTPEGSITNTTPAICSEDNVSLTINSLTIPSNPADLTFDIAVSSTDDPNLSGTASGNLNDVSVGTVINGTLINSSYNNIVVTYSITPKLHGCSAGTAITSNVTVYPTPDISVTNNTPVLPTGSLTDIVLDGNVAGTTFGWRVLNPGTTGASDGGGLAIGESIAQTLTNTTAVPVTVTYRIAPSANGCTGDSTDVTVQIDPNVEVSVTNNAPYICTGGNTDILIQSQVLGTTFDWTVNDPDMTGATAGSGGPNTHTIQQNLVNTGTTPVTVEYSITPKGPAPTFIVGSPKSTVVTIYPKPDGVYSNRAPRICNGSSANILLDSNVPGTTFTWTVTDPSGASGASPSGTNLAIGDSIYQTLNNPGTTPVIVTYHIRPVGENPTNCTGDVLDVDVIIDPTPAANLSNIAPVICSGAETDIQLNASVSNTTFTWAVADPKGTGATGGSGNIGDHIQQTLTNATQTPVTITYEIIPYGPGATSCPGAAEYIDVTVNPLPITTEITGTDKTCVNTSNLFYSVDLTPGSTYDWTIPAALGTVTFGGDGLNSNAVIINAAAAGAVDSIRVLETNQYGCVGTEKAKELIVSDQTPPQDIVGPAEVCDQATGITYNIPETAGSEYQWIVPTGGAIITDPNSDSIDVNFGSVSGNVRVIETNSAGCTTNHNPLFVTVNPLPASTINVNKTYICLGETVTFTAGPAAQANYEFFVDGVSMQNGPSNLFTTDAITNGQQVYVNVTTPSGCEKVSNSITMSAFANPLVSLSSSDTDDIICDGELVNFTASATNAVSYEFFLNSTSKQYSALNQFSTNTLTDKDTVYAVATTMFGCTGISNKIVTTVNQLPAGEISGDNIICPGDSTAVQVNVSQGSGPYSLRLSGGVGVISNYNSNDPVYVKPLSNTVYTIEEIIDANGCAVNSPDAALTGTASISLNQDVFLSQQPQSAMVCEGIDTSFTITGGGTGMAIQWQADDGGGFTDISDIAGVYSGTDASTLNILNPASSLSGYLYRAVVTGACGAPMTSDEVDLIVHENPEILSHPADVTACEDESVIFTVDAGVTTSAGFQWQTFNGSTWNNMNSGAPYSGVNNDTLIISAIHSGMNDNRYRVVVSGICNPAVESNPATLTVNEKPEIILQPADAEACEGQSVTFSINTGVTTGALVQWQVYDGTSWSDATGGVYSNDNTPVLNIDPVSSAMNGYEYRAVVSGTCTPEDTSATAALLVKELPEISLDPSDVTSCEGDTVTFETGTGLTTNASIQWQVSTDNGSSWNNVSGMKYSGTNSTVLQINGIESSMHNYRFKAVVSGDCAPAAESAAALLQVNEKPEFTLQPADQDICEGDNATYTINTGVTTSPLIQWQVWDDTSWNDASGAPYSGENTASLTVSGVTSAMNNFRYRAYLEGTCSPAVYSDSADLFVRENPEITSDPEDTAVCEGMNAGFTVDPGVTSSPTFTWYVSTDNGSSWTPASGADYMGANSSTLTVLATHSGMNNRQFKAEVGGSCPTTVISAPAVLTIYEQPEITTHPVDQTICEDGSVNFTVDASPTTNPSYQWEVNDGSSWYNAGGMKYSGQGTNSLTVSDITSSMSGYQYRVVISGTCTPEVTSDVAALTVNEKPEILMQPDDVTVCEDEPASFSINAGATTTPGYRWEIFDGSTWSAATGGIYSNENTNTIDLSSIPSSMNGYEIRAIVSGACTPEDTSANAKITVNERPEVTADPSDVTLCEGDTAMYVVSAGVTTDASYKWQVYNGSSWNTITGGIYSGYDDDTLRVNGALSWMNNFRYRVIISGTCSPSDTSAEASLTVRERPEITIQPADLSVCEDSPAAFEVNAGVTTSPVYRWQVDANTGTFTDITLAGHTGMDTNVLSIASGNSAMHEYRYRVIVSGMCAPADTSDAAELWIEEKPEVIENPKDSTVCEGENVSFSVDAGVTTNPSYQWKYFDGNSWQDLSDGGNVNGANTAVLNIYSVDSIMTGYQYKAEISGNCSPPVLSAPATLTVNTSPVVTLNPADVTLCEGLSTNFEVDATGTAVSYSWEVDMRDGMGFRSFTDTAGVYSGSDTNVLTIDVTDRRMNNYRFRARIEGTCTPAVNTSYAVLNINTAPEILTQPEPANICEFNNVTFTVDAQGAGLSYTWQESTGGPFYDLQDTGSYIGTTGASMSFFNIPESYDGNRYRVLITGTCNPAVASSAVELTVRTSPEIIAQPTDSTICQDNDAMFEVMAEGDDLNYQWQMSTGGPFSIILDDTTFSGTDTPVLTITDAETIMNGYKFRVRVTGSCVPPMVSDDAMLTVDANPRITIDPENAEICENGSAGFIGGAMGKDLNYQWQVFDGASWTDVSDGDNYSGSNTSTLSLLDVPVSFDGYRYRMMVTSNCITVFTNEANLIVNANPTSNITGDGTFPLVCGGFDLNLDGNPAGGSGTYTSHSWSGDVIPLNGYNSDQTVFNSYVNGSYNLTYTVTDSKGCKSSSSAVIENDMPAAEFNSDALPSCGYRMVNFTNTSSRAVSYEWHFDDGSAVETTADAAHGFDNYDPSGLVRYYDVKLVAKSANGCRDTANRIVTIYPKVDPEFTIDPDTACQPYVATLITQPGASSYTWDFGDGRQENSGYSVLHEYQNTSSEIETYTVTLKTTSFYGCIASSSKDVVVYPKPSPGFSVSPIVQTYPDATVEVSSMITPGPWTYSYDFGDGTVVDEENPTHTYAEAGNYKIIQIVSSGYCADSISQTVIVNPTAPTAAFEVPDPACTPMQIQFHNTSQFANAYKWDFGDGSISTKKDPVYTYFEPGVYKVSLTVSGPGGSDEFLADIEVWESPSAFFNNAPDSVYVNDKPVKFFNYSSGATGYFWDFGDIDETTGEIMNQNNSTEYDPHHIYESIGWKDVMMVAYNSNCRDTLYKENAVFVSPSGSLRFPNVFKPNPNGPTGGYFDPNDPSTINQIFSPGVIDRVLEYHLYIYNRWGELIFTSDEVNHGWDGYIKGRLARQGVYVWKVKGKYTNGKTFVEVGDVTLLH